MSLAIAIVLAVVALFGLLRPAALSFVLRVNADAFMAQIQKLVMANNIDRAVKLCNAVPNALLPQMVKALLTRANRTHELELHYQEQRAKVNVVRSVLTFWRGANLMLLLGGSLATAFMVLVFANDGATVGTSVAASLFVLLTMAGAWVAHSLYVHTVACEQYLLKTRNLLYSRNGVVPAFLAPRDEKDVSEDELEAWKQAMEGFNADYSRRKEAGEPNLGTPQEEHDRKADSSGVLPAL